VHPSDVIVTAAVRVIATDEAGLDEIKIFAQQKCKDKEYREAARMLLRAASYSPVFESIQSGNGVTDHLLVALCEDAFAALDCITDPDQVSFDLEADVCRCGTIALGRCVENNFAARFKIRCDDRLIEMSNNNKFDMTDKGLLAQVCGAKGSALSGKCQSASKDDEPPDQLAEASRLHLKGFALVGDSPFSFLPHGIRFIQFR
jgi:hypothetical protein